MTEIRKYYFGLQASVLAYQTHREGPANYWKLHFELSPWQRAQANRNVKAPFLRGALHQGVPIDTAERIATGWKEARARKTSPNQYDFLLPVLFLKKVFFGLFSLVLLDWVTG